MLYFENDYSEGAHPQVLERLIQTNGETLACYGTDCYGESAAKKIRAACACPDAEVFFLAGGTQTNQVVISSVLKNYEGVVAAATGHVNGHEAGAIEYTGHKVLPVVGKDGKIDAAVLAEFLAGFFEDANHEHMVFPGMVYISHPTEYGTLYSKSELSAVAAVCREYRLPLYLDGARLGYGLVTPGTDVTLPDIAEMCDVFYIGGTKVGALCGEAVVFTRKNAPAHFMTQVKQHGAMLAKGRLLSVQFDALFDNDLYFKISRHATAMADILRAALAEKGYRFFIETPTNQIFVVLDDTRLQELSKQVKCSFWEKYDRSHTVVRFATSWATKPEDVTALCALL